MKVDQDLKIKIVGKMPAGLPHFVLPVPWWTQRRAPSMSNTWDDLDLSGGFQRCERGQVKRTFVVNGFGDHRLESCYCTQYYCWWLFYPALANPLIGSYFSHSCVPQSHGFPWTKYISLISVPFIFIAVLVYDTLWSSFVLEHLLGHINWFFEKRTSHTKRQTFGKAMR